MDTILHITSKTEWLHARKRGSYYHDSLEAEGFIHCSYPAQVVATANRFFHGERELVLLEISPSLVRAEIKEEDVPLHGNFPHIYGELNLDAVVRVIDFEPNETGEFKLPRELS
ncbi:MAG: DUF952 domain-containing protein [Cyanobacteria bacterium SBLK]|nr:DUF952 domain-containing protein [Cyanobacteria bacterium SBLK]